MRSVLLLAAVFVTTSGSSLSQSPVVSRYSVKLTFSLPLTAHIEADLDFSGGKLSMYPFGDDNLENGWATYVRDLTIIDQKGNAVPFQKSGRAEWQLSRQVTDARLPA